MALAQIGRIPASKIVPGHVTIDGVVLEVDEDAGWLILRHRFANYMQVPDDQIVVFGQLDAEGLKAIQDAIDEGSV